MKTQTVLKSLSDLPFGVAALRPTWSDLAPRLLKILRRNPISDDPTQDWPQGAASNTAPSAGVGPHVWLKVLIAYEDFATGHRAMKVCENLIGQLGQEFQFRTCFWKFDLLRVPKLNAIATRDAAEADAVIISAHGAGELPGEVKSWLAGLRGKRAEATRALIALLDGSDPGSEWESQVHSFLQEFAQKARFDFFSHIYPIAGNDMEFSSSSVAAQSDATSSAFRETLRRPTAMRQWGINE